MPYETVNMAVLNSPELVAYLSTADHRIRVGFRAALETLNLPLPDFMLRRPSGRKPGQAVARAFASNPTQAVRQHSAA